MKKNEGGSPEGKKLKGTFSSFGMYDGVVLQKFDKGFLMSIIPNHGEQWYLVLEDEIETIQEIPSRNPGDFLHQFHAYEFSSYDDALWAFNMLKEGKNLQVRLSEMGLKLLD